MSDQPKALEEPTDAGICSAIEKAKADAEIEDRRDSRRFRHKLMLIFAFALAFTVVVLITGSTYGWLFLEKQFLSEPFQLLINGIVDVFKVLIG